MSDLGNVAVAFQMVGDQGKWQIVVFLFTWIEGILIGMYHLSSTFLGAQVKSAGFDQFSRRRSVTSMAFQTDHWCNTSYIAALNTTHTKGWTLEEKKNYSIPL